MKLASYVLCIAAVSTLSSCATVRLSRDETDALKALRQYIQLDRSGARLDGNRYHTIAELSNWADEPGWDLFVVTSGAVIGRPITGDDGKVRARVRYDAEGVMLGDAFTPVEAVDPETAARAVLGDPVEFVLVSTPDGWKVDTPQLPPHAGFVAARAAVADMGAENALRDLDDAEYRAKLKGARAGHCN